MSANDIISAISSQLISVMGPIAPFVISDKIRSFDATEDNFPTDKIGQLVERLSYEIQDEKGRIEFQKGALELIKQFAAHAGV